MNILTIIIRNFVKATRFLNVLKGVAFLKSFWSFLKFVHSANKTVFHLNFILFEYVLYLGLIKLLFYQG